jgi:hypothetical protein
VGEQALAYTGNGITWDMRAVAANESPRRAVSSTGRIIDMSLDGQLQTFVSLDRQLQRSLKNMDLAMRLA